MVNRKYVGEDHKDCVLLPFWTVGQLITNHFFTNLFAVSFSEVLQHTGSGVLVKFGLRTCNIDGQQ